MRTIRLTALVVVLVMASLLTGCTHSVFDPAATGTPNSVNTKPPTLHTLPTITARLSGTDVSWPSMKRECHRNTASYADVVYGTMKVDAVLVCPAATENFVYWKQLPALKAGRLLKLVAASKTPASPAPQECFGLTGFAPEVLVRTTDRRYVLLKLPVGPCLNWPSAQVNDAINSAVGSTGMN